LDNAGCPFCFDLDVIDALRCPNCDALFEHGKFVCCKADRKAQPNSDVLNEATKTRQVFIRSNQTATLRHIPGT
jgi:hypothetical protein